MFREMADSEEPEKTIADEAVVGKYAAAAEIANRKYEHIHQVFRQSIIHTTSSIHTSKVW